MPTALQSLHLLLLVYPKKEKLGSGLPNLQTCARTRKFSHRPPKYRYLSLGSGALRASPEFDNIASCSADLQHLLPRLPFGSGDVTRARFNHNTTITKKTEQKKPISLFICACGAVSQFSSFTALPTQMSRVHAPQIFARARADHILPILCLLVWVFSACVRSEPNLWDTIFLCFGLPELLL